MCQNRPIRGAEAKMYTNTSSRGNEETVCFHTNLKIRNKQIQVRGFYNKKVKIACCLFVIIVSNITLYRNLVLLSEP